jgi:hypothetical protein
MKLQILSKTQEPIGGFKTVIIENNSLDLGEISPNECEVILASDVVDSVTYSAIDQLMSALASKLRINGELTVGGTDVRMFATAVSNGRVSLEEASNIVTNVNSMTNGPDVTRTFESLGLEIQSISLEGVHYEIRAKRVS